MSYRSLDADEIVVRAEMLQRRIEERFPDRGLNNVCLELIVVAEEAKERADRIARPNWWLRILVVLLLGLLVFSIVESFIFFVRIPQQLLALPEYIQVFEAGASSLLFLGAAAVFLMTVERRIKQNQTLKALHELRSMAHVIDMHQMTKDPERVLNRGARTASSPLETMSSFELTRYLDYCAEMLALLGKVSAIYVQEFDDSVAVAAVNEIEDLTNGLSRKIWQKIMILHNLEHDQHFIEVARR